MDPLPILIFELDRDIAKILAVILALVWVVVLFVFFAMAINMSRMRKDIRTLQEIASAQHHEAQQREYERKLKEYEQHQQQYAQQQPPPATPPTHGYQSQPTSQEFPQQPPAH